MRTSAHWNAENRAKSPESRIRSKLGIPMSSQAIASPSMMQECERRRARSPQCVIGLLILARSHVRVVGEAERFGLLPFARRPRRSQITTKRRLDLNAHTPVVPPPQYGSTIGEFLRADVECNSSFALAWRAAMMNCLVAGRRGNTVAHNHARSPRSLGEQSSGFHPACTFFPRTMRLPPQCTTEIITTTADAASSAAGLRGWRNAPHSR